MFSDLSTLLTQWTQEKLPDEERAICSALERIWSDLELPAKAQFFSFQLDKRLLTISVASPLLMLNLGLQKNQIKTKVNLLLRQSLTQLDKAGPKPEPEVVSKIILKLV